MMWNDRTEVKKGNIGEDIFHKLLNKCVSAKRGEAVPYVPHPAYGGSHPVDTIYVNAKEGRIIAFAEIKTKPSRKHFPDTGIDIDHYELYCNLKKQNGAAFYLIFVDEHKGKVYKGELSHISQPCDILYNGKTLHYPLTQESYPNGKKYAIRYFPLKFMETIYDLSDEEIRELKKITTRKYEYKNGEQENFSRGSLVNLKA